MMHVLPLVAAFLLIFHHFGRGLIYGRLYDSRPLELVGVAMTLAGHSLAVWARVHLGRYWSGMITLKEDHELIRTGPYRWARHPIYSGFLLAVLGSAIAAGTGDAFIGFGLILIALLIKMRREEALMTREFGEQYQRFRREVAALVPFVY
ncbi:MAG TPA: isoprenylcysteine carboxylmethyltransferase family protein [Tepidisphaeraceae bacterium]|jgi:protein-S-isoprenylcysteine O-methyltransferase Ste14